MQKRHWIGALALVGILVLRCALLWREGANSTPGTAPAGDPAAAPSAAAPVVEAKSAQPNPLDHLMEDLGSKDAAARAGGEARLALITTLQRAELSQLAAGATDPQIAALLQKRVAELNEEAALDPPPISVSFKDAPLIEVAQALGKATGEPIALRPSKADMGDLFTLTANDRPFWNVINDLNHEHTIHVTTGVAGWSLSSGPPSSSNGIRGEVALDAKPAEFTPVHAFVAFAEGVRTAMPTVSSVQLAPGELMLDYTLAADPRLRIADAQFAEMSATIDGAALPVVRCIPPTRSSLVGSNVWGVGVIVRPPEGATGKTAILKGSATISITIEEASVELNEPEKHLNELIDLDGETVTLQRFAVTGQRLNYGLSKKNQTLAITITVIDGNGEFAARFMGLGATTGGMKSGTFTPPFKVRLSRPIRTREVTIPIEIHDIALP